MCVFIVLAESWSTILNRKVWISFLASYFIGNTEGVVYWLVDCVIFCFFFSLWWLYVCDLQSSLCSWHTEVCRQACRSFSKLVIDVGVHYTLNVSISRLMIHRFYIKQGEQSIDNKPVSKSNPVSTSASAPAS